MSRRHYFYDNHVQLPRLSVGLVSLSTHVQNLEALIDSGANTNVLPRSIGDALGFEWQESEYLQTPQIRGIPALSVFAGVVFQDFGVIEIGRFQGNTKEAKGQTPGHGGV